MRKDRIWNTFQTIRIRIGYEVKTTLDNVKRLKVKPTRYWNELLVKDVPDDVLYSLSDYHPGLPFEADIIRDNESLGLPILSHSRNGLLSRPGTAKSGQRLRLGETT